MDDTNPTSEKEAQGDSDEQNKNARPLTVLGDFLQPGFPLAKVFTVFFLENALVFAKTGSGPTDAAGTLSAYFGGAGPDAMIAKGVGSLVDHHSGEQRSDKAGQLAAYDAEQIVAGHKRNFMIPFDAVKMIEIKGPNFAGEVRVIITADKAYKFRLNKQSKDSTQYVESVFEDFLPGKVVKR